MKKIFLILPALAFFLNACQRNDGGSTQQDDRLTFYAKVVEDELTTRGTGNDFFEVGQGIDVVITPNGASPVSYIYTYGSDGVFRGNPGYRFTLDDQYLKNITATWPINEVRKGEFKTDQRKLENHRLADWMTATAKVQGVMPTSAPVPLNFVRENAKLEFELAGQNASGLRINSLLFELQDDEGSRAYWAYCGNDNGHAELLIEGGTVIKSTDNYLIGILTVEEEKEVDYFIVFPAMTQTLEAGKRYLVTLTPQGYDIDAFVYIGTFSQIDDAIGIPFAPPAQGSDGTFIISEPRQLVAMSYLIRHYDNPATFDWQSATYVIDPEMVMTAEFAELYIAIPQNVFSGSITLNGMETDSIEYADGEILYLYEQ